MRALGIALGALGLALVAPGCAGRTLKAGQAAHGNVAAELAGSRRLIDPERVIKPLPQIVLVERHGLRALDPDTGREQWMTSLRVNGHATANRGLIVVPVTGNRLAAVERHTGSVRWIVKLPGAVVTGVALAEPFVFVTVRGQEPGRIGKKVWDAPYRVVALTTHEGVVRWMRRSFEPLGAPAAKGRALLVPQGKQVVALGAGSGFERARVDLPLAAERVELRRGSLLAGAGQRWVDLRAADMEPLGILERQAAVLRQDRGVDPGHDDAERLRWWVRVPKDGSTPREGVLLARRAVVAARMDAKGRAVGLHWIYRARDEREFVSMHVGRERVTLVREDGAILHLATADGKPTKAIAGGEPVRGALMLDLSPDDRPVMLARPDEARVVRAARALLAEPDPRLLPAQELVAEVLWRDDQPEHRKIVAQLASGELRPEASPAAERLRGVAAEILARPWGTSTGDSVETLLAELGVRPSFLGGRPPGGVGPAARRAVRTGDPRVVPLLVAQLLHPATDPRDLVEVARALEDLDRPEALDGVRTFVLRYHADAAVIYESGAMEHAVSYLVSQADAGQEVARETLQDVLADPFTDPSIRAYIDARMSPAPKLAAASGAAHEHTP